MRMRGGLPGRSQAHTYFMQSRSTFISLNIRCCLKRGLHRLKAFENHTEEKKQNQRRLRKLDNGYPTHAGEEWALGEQLSHSNADHQPRTHVLLFWSSSSVAVLEPRTV